MTTPIDNNPTLQPENEFSPTDGLCKTTVHENVCVQATVTITPSVKSGESKSTCLGSPIFGCCPGELRKNCVFTVSQHICVEIPLVFSAVAKTQEDGIVCGKPSLGSCGYGPGCPHPVG